MASKDFAYEALAEVTNSDWNTARGELNAALKLIREQAPEIVDNYLLSAEIHERAKMYREVMGDALLTPPALAKHWRRLPEEREVMLEADRAKQRARAERQEEMIREDEEREDARRARRSQQSNLAADVSCKTCGGDRFVLVATRKPVESTWMQEKELKPRGEIEEMAPCPDCNAGVDTSFWRGDGTKFRSPDPARVREMMRG